jgi:death-on-curing protein
MRWLRLAEVLELHRRLIQQSGGMAGLRDLGFSLIQNHPFVDGNKRIGHAAMETTLVLNGFELSASVDAAEAAVIAVASGRLNREAFTRWVMANQRLLDLP